MMKGFERSSAMQAAARWKSVFRQAAWSKARFPSTETFSRKTMGVRAIEMERPHESRPEKDKALSRFLGSAERFRLSCNFCVSFLSSFFVPDVSLLSARRFLRQAILEIEQPI